MPAPHLTRLSVIDVAEPEYVVPTAQLVEKLGYAGYWLTEHHTPTQSGSPLIAAAVAVACTTRIRIGTAGVMLRYYRPARVSKDFLLLNRLFSGRIDLGLIGGQAADPALDRALRSTDSSYESSLTELVHLLRNETDEGHPYDRRLLGPSSIGSPGMWLCSNKLESALLAARLGVGFIYHHFFARARDGRADPSIVAAYREAFNPTQWMPVPDVRVACYGSCASSDEQAKHQWLSALGGSKESTRAASSPTGNGLGPCFHGTPRRCIDELSRLAATYAVEELLIQCFARDASERHAGYELLAAELIGGHGREPNGVHAPS